jgi:hypothetical protein
VVVHLTACLYGLAFGAGYHRHADHAAATMNATTNATAHTATAHTTTAHMTTAQTTTAIATATARPFRLTYMYALWWAVGALSSLGALSTPQSAAELGFSAVVLAVGLSLVVYVVALLRVLVSHRSASALALRKGRLAAERFVRQQAIPEPLAMRICRYQELAWESGAGPYLKTVIDELSPTVRADIMHHICHAVVIALPLFMGCEPKLILLLVEAMVHDVCPQGEWVCRRGSIATCMYIILRGEIAVVVDELRMLSVARLDRGDFFGERSLFGLEKRNASIMAKTTVDLAVLSADAFGALLREQPTLHDAIDEAKQRREAEMEVARGLVQPAPHESDSSPLACGGTAGAAEPGRS